MIYLLGKTKEEIAEEMEALGHQKFRAKQLYHWIYTGTDDFDKMNNIPKDLKNRLKDGYRLRSMQIVSEQEDENDQTKKYLFELEDGNTIEAVLMRYSHGETICISTQVGCNMGCDFCASAIGGCLRNLSAGEMVEQIIQIENKENLRIRNIVLMGSGEPFDNYQQVIRFLEVVTDPQGLDKGKRHISISTSGIVPKIYDFAEYDNQYHLSISLHSPFQKVREKLMPIGKKHSLEELMKACLYYEQKTNRKITFEYAMIKDVNDDAQSARELANILKPFSLAMVNLIAVNEVKEKNYYKSNEKTIEHFRSILRKNGVHVTVRRKLGSSINAACGQLRRGERQS